MGTQPTTNQHRELTRFHSHPKTFVAHTFPDLYEALRQDLKGRLGRGFQFGLIVFAALTLGLIVFN